MQDEAEAELSRAALERNHETGVGVFGSGTVLNLTEGAVRDTNSR